MSSARHWNRMWSDLGPTGSNNTDAARRRRKEYVPSHERPGFDESKIIRLAPGETSRGSR